MKMIHVIVIALLSQIVCLQASGNSKNSAKHGDYIGCYGRGCLRLHYDVNSAPDVIVTPSTCTGACQENGFPLAGVYNRSKCSCSCKRTCRNKPLDDDNCGLPCRSAPNKICGGFTAVSVYTVRLSVTLINTTCGTLEEEGNTTSDVAEDHSGGDLVNKLISPILIGISFIVVITVVFIRTRRRGTHRPSSPPRSRSESAPSERAINQDHQNTSRYEQSTLPRTQPLPQPLSLTGNDSTSPLDSLSRRRADSDTGSNLYFTLEAEHGQDEARAGRFPNTEFQSEGTAEYAYVDLAERSTSFRREMVEKKGADDDSKIDEDGMVVNDLYAMPHKTRRI